MIDQGEVISDTISGAIFSTSLKRTDQLEQIGGVLPDEINPSLAGSVRDVDVSTREKFDVRASANL